MSNVSNAPQVLRRQTHTHGCNYPMVGWPSVILTPMGPSLNLTREGTSRPSLRSSLSLTVVTGTRLDNHLISPAYRQIARNTYTLHVEPPSCLTLGRLGGLGSPAKGLCVCESYIGKPIGTRAVPQFTTGVAKPLTQIEPRKTEHHPPIGTP